MMSVGNKKRFVIKMINALRETEPYIETIYTKGGCYKFHLFLKRLWPEALPVKNKDFDHIGTLIDGVCYDIKGIVDWQYYDMTLSEIHQAEKWSFAAYNLLFLGECPACEEPLVV
jgi:hypothetical protein